LENRVYDLDSKAQKTAKLFADLIKARSKITELEARVSTQKAAFTDRPAFPGRIRAYNSQPVPSLESFI